MGGRGVREGEIERDIETATGRTRKGSLHRAASGVKRRISRAVAKTCDRRVDTDEDVGSPYSANQDHDRNKHRNRDEASSSNSSFEGHTIQLVDNDRVSGDTARDVEKAVPPTPSMLSLAGFKQRPRQGSILGMVRGFGVENTELGLGGSGGEDGEEDSILAGLRRSSSVVVDGEDEDRHVGEEEERRDTESVVHSSASRKRKAAELEEARIASSPPHLPLSDNHEQDLAEDVIHSSSPAPPSNNDVNADTSTTPPPPFLQPPIHQTSPPLTATSPLSSPQSSVLTTVPSPPHFPSRSRTTRTTKAPPPPQPKTAQLQALLPKRMKIARDAYRESFAIYDSSELEVRSGDGVEEDGEDGEGEGDEEEDELTRPMRRRRVAAAVGKKTATATRKAGKGGKTPLRKGQGKSAATSTSTSTTTTAPSTRGVKKTYSRRAADNDNLENAADEHEVPDEDDGEETETGRGRTAPVARKLKLSDELKVAKEKFREVDEWELEFESCDVGGGGSSPWR